MHKRKLYKCLACGAEVFDLPMTVLKHQMSHVRRRPFARATGTWAKTLHFQKGASWLVEVLQQLAHCGPNFQLTSERVQTGRQSDVTEKQSQRLECHFGVTGMILFAIRCRQPAGGWGAPSVQPNPSEL